MDKYEFAFKDIDSLVIAVRDLRKMYTHLFISSFHDTLILHIRVDEMYNIYKTDILDIVKIAGGSPID